MFIILVTITALGAISLLVNLSLLDKLDTERKRATQFEEYSKLHFRRKLAAEAQLFCALRELDSVPPERRTFARQNIGRA